MRRRDVLVGAAGLAVASIGGGRRTPSAWGASLDTGVRLPAQQGLFWGINTNIKFHRDDSQYRRRVIDLTRELNIGYVREAVLDVGGRSVDEPFAWGWLDAAMSELEAAGLGCVLALRIEDCDNPDRFGAAWEANVRNRVQNTIRRYGRQVLWYMPWNEPDHTPIDAPTVLRMQEIVYRQIKDIDPSIPVQSAPLSSPRGEDDLMERLCVGGITRLCDYLGCHKHIGIEDDNRYGFPYVWRAQQQGAQAGHPVRPVYLTENGCRWTIFKAADQHVLRAHWAMLNLVQVKRFGCARGIVFSLAGTRKALSAFDLVDSADGFSKWQPEFDTYREAYNAGRWSLARGINGGFEEAQADKTAGWVVHYNPRRLGGDPVPYAEWDRVTFATDGAAARTGKGYCRMMPGGANTVRRLVEELTPGRNYVLSGYVRLEGQGAHATLAAMGHDPLNGLADVTRQTEVTGDWIRLDVPFTPINPWVVIGLDHNGQGTAVWDDIALEAGAV